MNSPAPDLDRELRRLRGLRKPTDFAAAAFLALAAYLALSVGAGPALAQAQAQAQPEIHTGFTRKQAVEAKSYMISAANPHAARAGYEILKKGGSATDAAIAAALMLTLVEPQASGIGGGGYIAHWSEKNKRIDNYDGRVTAPMTVKPDHFLEADGEPARRAAAGFGGRTVGVPGQLRLFAMAHGKHGNLPWKELFQPVIALAESGFEVSPRLHKQIAGKRKRFEHPETRAYFLDPDGEARPVGHRLVNRELAALLRAVAERGVDAFYKGAVAADIAKAVTDAPEHPSPMTAEDIAGYRAKPTSPICAAYRRHRVCGMAPSSTGGLTVAMILRLLKGFDMKSLGPDSPDAAHLFVEASRLAHADRGRYIGDPAFVSVPVRGLLDPGYLAGRARRIDPDAAMERPRPGRPPRPPRPPMKRAMHVAPADESEPPSTTHLSVVDAEGNAVALTASLGRGFGSGIMVRGFLLNDQLVAFSFRPSRNGAPAVNRPDGGKRPRSSMSPTLVFRPDGGLRLVIGSPGGIRIVGYVAKTLVAMLDWSLDIQSAISLPHFAGRSRELELEKDTPATRFREALEKKGHSVSVRRMTSGLHGIEIMPDGRLVGGADPRREGVVLGD